MPNKLVITKIKSLCESNAVREYDFKYKRDYYTQLVQVQEFADNRTDSLNTTIFEWGNENATKYQLVDAYSQFSSDKKLYSGDFNGDGKADYVLMEDKPVYTASDKWYLLLFNQETDDYSVTDSGYLDMEFRGITVVDFDNDGDDDMYWKYDQTIAYECNCRPCDPGGGGFMQAGIQSLGLLLFVPPPPQDTCCDICFLDKQLFKFYREQSGSLYNYTNLDLEYNTTSNYNLHPGDFDGDGKPELMVLGTSHNVVDFEGIYVSPYPSFGSIDQMDFLDINGNGKTDIMTRTGSSIDVWEYDTDDSEFEMIIQDYSISIGGVNFNRIYPGDFNGDGKADILIRHDNLSDSTKTKILLSEGDDFIVRNSPVYIPVENHTKFQLKTIPLINAYLHSFFTNEGRLKNDKN
ncbi:MAG: VCBS repeat-containing protein, partial [Deltaproteobacteria bacterium]|nr:VCBS repeat-containing protein [Deltaproteobacteria bacterium]